MSAMAATAAHLLVVDDDQDLLRLLTMRLHAWGYRVSTAASAEEGLARIAVEPPQLVLSDIRLPGKDGLALFDEIRATRPTLPVILLTGLAFAALGLIVNALAPSYDFFMYYFTLFITPMTLVSGVFFPADQLPPLLHSVAAWLPLSHAVQLTRPLLNGEIPANVTGHIAALAGITVVAFYIATILTRRRLLK